MRLGFVAWCRLDMLVVSVILVSGSCIHGSGVLIVVYGVVLRVRGTKSPPKTEDLTLNLVPQTYKTLRKRGPLLDMTNHDPET